jgi:hypothetical protein
MENNAVKLVVTEGIHDWDFIYSGCGSSKKITPISALFQRIAILIFVSFRFYVSM